MALFALNLLVSANMIAAGSSKEYPIGVIPGLKIPVKMVDYKWSQFSPLDSIILAGSVLLHGTLVCTSTANTIRTKIAQHALLWAASHGTGVLQTFSHELGHAVVDHARGAKNIEIGIGGDYVTLLTGIYVGATYRTIQPPSVKTYDKEQSVTTKEDLLEYIDLHDQYKRSEIKSAIAGPLSGTVTGYGIFKLAQSKYPAVFRNRWFKGICLAGVLGQTINFAPLHPALDGATAHRAWQERSKMLEIKAEIQKLPAKTGIKLN